ncbi:MAG: hypothetical protein M3Q71_23415 [Chloroflexota bacterium]|nr:hypothetical protein [Chloroflexota bacterium]
MKRGRVADLRATLERHGIDPDADVAALTTAIEARGWVVRVEKGYVEGRGHHYHAYASKPAPDIHPSLGIMLQLSAEALARQAVLVRVLAKILAREERPHPGPTGLIRGRRR